MEKQITVAIDYCEEVEEGSRFTASIDDDVYLIVVSGRSIADCFQQIGITMDCVDNHNAKATPTQPAV